MDRTNNSFENTCCSLGNNYYFRNTMTEEQTMQVYQFNIIDKLSGEVIDEKFYNLPSEEEAIQVADEIEKKLIESGEKTGIDTSGLKITFKLLRMQ